jgi:hypothetical protein
MKKTSETKGNLLRLWCANCFCFFQESFRFFPALLLPLLPPQPCFFCSRTLTKLWLTHEKKMRTSCCVKNHTRNWQRASRRRIAAKYSQCKNRVRIRKRQIGGLNNIRVRGEEEEEEGSSRGFRDFSSAKSLRLLRLFA